MHKADPSMRWRWGLSGHLGRIFGAEVLLFFGATAVMLATALGGIGFVNAARGYAIGTQAWIFHSAHALTELRLFDATGEKRHLDAAERSLSLPIAASHAKAEIQRSELDLAKARGLLRAAGVEDQDVTPMVFALRLFSKSDAVKEVLTRWDEGDRQIDAIDQALQRASAGRCASK